MSWLNGKPRGKSGVWKKGKRTVTRNTAAGNGDE